MRAAAGYVLFHGDGPDRRFLLLRNARHRTWAFPKGHLEDGETPLEGARRELIEETGIREVEVVPDFADSVEYDVPAGKRPGSPGGYRKKVHWFLARAPSRAWTRSPEHDDGRWVAATEVESMLQHDNFRELFRRALAHLAVRDGRG